MHLRPAWPPLAVASLSPASFGFVMATGIVGIAARQQQMHALARALFDVNVAAWLALAAMNLLRVARHAGTMRRELQDHARGLGFFTAVAGTAVLASQIVLLGGPVAIASLLAAGACVLCLGLTYAVFLALTIRPEKPPLEQGLNGSWLLAVVALQSLVMVGGLLSPQLDAAWRLPLDFAAVVLWLFAGMLYTWLMALTFYRYTFLRFKPDDLGPAAWINMGAMAISALAGTQLVANAAQSPFLASMLPFMKGFTLLYWATGTWWIPLLAMLSAWRLAASADPLRWNPLAWAAIFPLGMYAAATHRLGVVMELPFLQGPARAFLYLALAAWGLALGRLLRHWVSAGAAHKQSGSVNSR